jgi:autotransporter-associated beta strand protein
LDAVVANGTFDISQGANQVIGNLSGSGVVNLGSKKLTLHDATTQTFSGAINNGGLGGGTGGSLALNGGGKLILSGTNTFTGTTALTNSSIVDYQSSGAFAQTSAITVANGSTVELDGGIVGGSASMSLAGAGANGGALENVTGSNSYAGAITLTDATAIQSDSGSTLALSGNISNSVSGGTTLFLTGNSTGANTISGAISDGTGPTSLEIDGANWVLANANTFTGGTALVGGALQLNHANALQNSTVDIETANGLKFNNTASGGSTYNVGALTGTVGETLTDTGNHAVTVVAGSNGASTTYSGTLSGLGGITKTGSGVMELTAANTNSGATTVNAGTLLITNTTGSATGSGALAVLRGGTLAGTGASSGTGFAIGATGTGTANVLVGQTSTGDTNATSNMTLIGGSGLNNSTIANANLTFNLNTDTTTNNQLLVGNTGIAFGSAVTLTLNLQGSTPVTNVPYFVLIAGTAGTSGAGQLGSQYTGLSLGTSIAADGGTLTQILNSSVGGSGNLVLALNTTSYSPGSAGFYGGQGGLYLFQTSGGIDDIVVIPEPSTWAMMLGGLAVLIFWQRRKNKLS